MRTSRCPHRCPVGWGTYDPVRTPREVRLIRTALFATAAIFYVLAVMLHPHYSVMIGFGLASLLTLLGGFGQTAILDSLAQHPEHDA